MLLPTSSLQMLQNGDVATARVARTLKLACFRFADVKFDRRRSCKQLHHAQTLQRICLPAYKREV